MRFYRSFHAVVSSLVLLLLFAVVSALEARDFACPPGEKLCDGHCIPDSETCSSEESEEDDDENDDEDDGGEDEGENRLTGDELIRILTSSESELRLSKFGYDEHRSGENEKAILAAAAAIYTVQGEYEEADEAVTEWNALYSGTASLNREYREQALEEASLLKGTSRGDPVRIGNGRFHFSVEDLRIPFFSSPIVIERYYECSGQGSASFGPSWFFTYDTRIIRSYDPASESLVLELESKIEIVRKALDRAIASFEEAFTAYEEAGSTRRDLEDFSAAALSYASCIDEKIRLFESIREILIAEGSSSLIALIDPFLSDLSSRKRKIDAELSSIDAAMYALEESLSLIRDMEEMLEALSESADVAGREAELASRYRELNSFVLGPNDPAYLYSMGSDFLSLITEQGIPLLFKVEDSGRIAYGPDEKAGSLLISSQGYTWRRQDGKVFFYSQYGLLSRIEDRNGNGLDFSYDGNGGLLRISDDGGRSVDIERRGRRVSRITSPAGAEIIYCYDDADRLIMVTDPAGDSGGYRYSGGRLTAIVKPDGSARRISYSSYAGRAVVESVTDEEGFTEHYAYDPDTRCLKITDPSGNSTSHYYGDLYLETCLVHPDGTKIEREYNEQGQCISIRDEEGNLSIFEYDDKGRLIRLVDPKGHWEKWTYGQGERPLSYQDKRGFTTAFHYDADGKFRRIRYPDGIEVSFSYDRRGCPVNYTDPAGNSYHMSWNSYGYLTDISGPLSWKKRFKYDEEGRLVSVSDSLGNTEKRSYNPDGTLHSITGPAGNTEYFHYDNRKDCVLHIDKSGNAIEYLYDKRHLLRAVINPLGEKLNIERSPGGRVTSVSLGEKVLYKYFYSSRGFLEKVLFPGTEQSCRYGYDDCGRLSSLSRGEGCLRRFVYDSLGQIVSEIDAEGFELRYSYDREGNCIAYFDKNKARYSFRYDCRNRLVSRTGPLGAEESYSYDELGNICSYRSPRNFLISYIRDELGRLTDIEYPESRSESFFYDSIGRVIAYQDRNDNNYSFSYDSGGRLESIKDPLGFRERFIYDAEGRLREWINKRGYSSKIEYDVLGRPVQWTDPSGACKTLSYDDRGNVIRFCDKSGNAWAYDYGRSGRPVSVTNPLGETWRYSYNALAKPASRKSPSGDLWTYQYSDRGQLVTETDPLGRSLNVEYGPEGKIRTVIFPDGSRHSRDYDIRGRLTIERNTAGLERSFQYDASGNICAKTDYNGDSYSYRYDGLGRLLEIESSQGSKNFSYDGNGNILHAGYKGHHNSAYNYVYDALDRLIFSEKVGSGLSSTFSYDANGNRIGLIRDGWDAALRFEYGPSDELITLSRGREELCRLRYDEAGREAQRRYSNGISLRRSYDQTGRHRGLAVFRAGEESFSDLLWADAWLFDKSGRRNCKAELGDRLWLFRYDENGALREVLSPQNELSSAVPFGADRPKINENYRLSREEVSGLEEVFSELCGERKKLRKALFSLSINDADRKDVVENDFEHKRSGLCGSSRRGLSLGSLESFGDSAQAGMELLYGPFDRLEGRSIRGSDAALPGGSRRSRYEVFYEDLSYQPARIHARGSLILRDSGAKEPRNSGGRFRSPLAGNAAPYSDQGSYAGPSGDDARRGASERRDYIWEDSRLLLRFNSDVSEYPVCDHLGSPLMWFSSEISLIDFHNYDAFGFPMSCSEDKEPVIFGASGIDVSDIGAPVDFCEKPFLGFTGKLFDPILCLYDFGSRWYDPHLGRFIRPDPFSYGWDWYAYADGDPLNKLDPDGLIPVYADDVRGKPIIAYPGRRLKEETSIRIFRGDPSLAYSSIIQINVKDQVLYKADKLQSFADIPEPALSERYNGFTIENAVYWGEFMADNPAVKYQNRIRLVTADVPENTDVKRRVIGTDAMLIHPNEITNPLEIRRRKNKGNKVGPFVNLGEMSAGCQVMYREDFDVMTAELQGLGFKSENKDRIAVRIKNK